MNKALCIKSSSFHKVSGGLSEDIKVVKPAKTLVQMSTCRGTLVLLIDKSSIGMDSW